MAEVAEAKAAAVKEAEDATMVKAQGFLAQNMAKAYAEALARVSKAYPEVDCSGWRLFPGHVEGFDLESEGEEEEGEDKVEPESRSSLRSRGLWSPR